MNISIIGVLPWRELDLAAKTDTRFYVISIFMQRIYGQWAGNLVSILIMWTFASKSSRFCWDIPRPLLTMMETTSRPWVICRASLSPTSLLALGGAAVLFCLLRLADVIAALVVIRIMVSSQLLTVGIMVLRTRRPRRNLSYVALSGARAAGHHRR